jgi:hypothetical protein
MSDDLGGGLPEHTLQDISLLARMWALLWTARIARQM